MNLQFDLLDVILVCLGYDIFQQLYRFYCLKKWRLKLKVGSVVCIYEKKQIICCKIVKDDGLFFLCWDFDHNVYCRTINSMYKPIIGYLFR